MRIFFFQENYNLLKTVQPVVYVVHDVSIQIFNTLITVKETPLRSSRATHLKIKKMKTCNKVPQNKL